MIAVVRGRVITTAARRGRLTITLPRGVVTIALARGRLTITAPRGRPVTIAARRARLTTTAPRGRPVTIAARRARLTTTAPRGRLATIAAPRGPLTTAVRRTMAFASGASMLMIPKNAGMPRAASTDKRIVASLVLVQGIKPHSKSPLAGRCGNSGPARFPLLSRASFQNIFWMLSCSQTNQNVP
jgi:hypothetical protein